ncbi:MAG: hemerythrin domain-containing protein [Lacipirellulaceae bacterium]
MAAGEWDHELFKVIKRKNEELYDSIEAVRLLVAGRSYEKLDLEKTMDELHDLLELHFEIEERGGYLADLVKNEPRYEARVGTLLSEHRALLEQCEKLRLLVRSGVESPAFQTRIESDFHKFLSRFLAHEHAEHQLLQGAFSDDIGSGD